MGISKKITIILIILALAGIGVWSYVRLRQATDKKSAVPALRDSAGNIVDQVRQQEFNDALKNISAADQDLDGLSDSEEAKYRTFATSSDTDDDGLTDGQEVSIFQTDPLKADTDSDGLSDGYEARHGTDPLVQAK